MSIPHTMEGWEAMVFQEIADAASTIGTLSQQAGVIVSVARVWETALRSGNTIYFCGNGGSAADAQHIAAELVGRFQRDRKPLPAKALTTDTSILTAVANDFGFETVFSRQVAAYCRPGDVVVGLSTSGSSKNVIDALQEAGRRGGVTVAFVGQGGPLAEIADFVVTVSSRETCRIQEAHITIGHIICRLVEEWLFNGSSSNSGWGLD